MTTDKDQNNNSLPAKQNGGSGRLPARKVVLPQQEKHAINIRDYIHIFFKFKRMVLISFVAVILISAMYPLFIYTPRYDARSLLLVKFGWENMSTELLPDGRQTPMVNQGEIMQSEVSILRSKELKERVVGALKPEVMFPQLVSRPMSGVTNADAAIYLLEKDLSVTPEKGNSITVIFSGENPEMAATIVNQLVDSYIDRRNDIYKDPKSVFFLEKKADEYAQKLADAEGRLKIFRAETNVVSFEDQKSMMLKQQHELQLERATLQSEKDGILEKITEIERQMNSIPKFSQTSETALSYRIRETEQKILDLQLLERELAAKYKDENKLLIGARERLKISQDFLENQRKAKPAEVVDPTWQELQKQLFAARASQTGIDAKLLALDGRLRDIANELTAFESNEQKNKALVREVADNTDKLRSYRKKLDEAKIVDDLNRQKMTSVSVVERASPLYFPSNPFRPLFIFIPVVLGIAIVVSLGIAYVWEMLSQSLSTPTEAEKRLELPVLVTISAK